MARQSDDQKSQNKIEGTSKTDLDGSFHSAASESGNGLDSEISEVPFTPQPENTNRTLEVASENQTSKGCCSEYHTLMYRAALKGDWQAAEILLVLNPNVVCDRITKRGETALHVAAAFKHKKFVRELVKWMSPSDLSLPDAYGYTAFCYAAASGIVEIAAVMREKNESLLTIRCEDRTPLYMAALLGNIDMVSYLLLFTRVKDLSPKEWFDLLLATIRHNMYDVALEILKKDESLAPMRNEEGRALRLLAQKDISDISASRKAILESFVTMFTAIPCLSWLKNIFEQSLMPKKARMLVWTVMQGVEQANFLKLILHDAAKVGNVEIITMLTRIYPDLLWETDDNKHTIFHIAVLHRQERVFGLIHQIGATKDLIAISTDEDGNNILHLAGKLARRSRRNIVSGAALQMQRELLWFKEVEKIVPTSCHEMKNKENYRPRALFSKKHRWLLKNGETWMKEKADSCMLIATIMLTMVFTAAFTVPGGNNGETGIPILLKRTWFKVFVVSDAVAMFCSTFSIIMFLSILTSRFREEDFLVSLPRKLIAGFVGLFVSLVGTILAFTSTYFLLFTGERAWLPILVAAFACVLLIVLFVAHHFKMFFDTLRSTYQYAFLFRSSKHSLY